MSAAIVLFLGVRYALHQPTLYTSVATLRVEDYSKESYDYPGLLEDRFDSEMAKVLEEVQSELEKQIETGREADRKFGLPE